MTAGVAPERADRQRGPGLAGRHAVAQARPCPPRGHRLGRGREHSEQADAGDGSGGADEAKAGSELEPAALAWIARFAAALETPPPSEAEIAGPAGAGRHRRPRVAPPGRARGLLAGGAGRASPLHRPWSGPDESLRRVGRRPVRSGRANCYYLRSANPPQRLARQPPGHGETPWQSLTWTSVATSSAGPTTRTSCSGPRRASSVDVIDQMSWWKGEPEWMRQFRLRSLRTFERKPMAPWFAVNMPDIDFQDIYYYIKPTDRSGQRVGRPARADEGHLREARHPRGRAQVPGRRHRAVRVPPGLDPGVDHAGHAADQGDRAGRRGVRARRGTRSRSSSPAVVGGGVLRREGGLRAARPAARTIGASGEPPLPRPARRAAARSRRGPAIAPRWVAGRTSCGSAIYVAVPTDLPEFGRPAALGARHVHTAPRRSPTPTCAGSSASASATATCTTAPATCRSRSPSTARTPA